MKAVERWCIEKPFIRRFTVWTHLRPMDGVADQIWWHVELKELRLEFADVGQRNRATAWANVETTYAGYGPTLAEATRNALRRAKRGVA